MVAISRKYHVGAGKAFQRSRVVSLDKGTQPKRRKKQNRLIKQDIKSFFPGSFGSTFRNALRFIHAQRKCVFNTFKIIYTCMSFYSRNAHLLPT